MRLWVSWLMVMVCDFDWGMRRRPWVVFSWNVTLAVGDCGFCCRLLSMLLYIVRWLRCVVRVRWLSCVRWLRCMVRVRWLSRVVRLLNLLVREMTIKIVRFGGSKYAGSVRAS